MGYIVSFMPGSRGRLISNIIFKLVNNINADIEFTEYDSAHNFIDPVNLNLIEDPKLIVANKEIKQVFFTHSFPKYDWPKNFTTILINSNIECVQEILLNAAIKNIFPKLEKQIKGETLSDRENKFLSYYKTHYPELNCDVLCETDARNNFLKAVIKDNYNQKKFYSNFIDSNSFDGYTINYKDMFNIKDQKYIVLDNLLNYLGHAYRQDIHSIYEKYDKNKYDIFTKYCPWFLKEHNEKSNV